jgi:DNA gyrase/topoisomerase IV subunit B
MMPNENNYTSSDIKVLSDREHVRLRVEIYLGNTHRTNYSIPLFLNNKFEIKEINFVPAVYKACNECIDNILDEFTQHRPKNPLITIGAHPILGMYEIEDNGRGVPIGKHETGKYTPEVVFSSLRSGRNFKENKNVGVIGMNGMGVSLTCMVSTEFKIEIHRDKKRYIQRFSDGADSVSKPSIRKYSGNKTGTKVQFQLDPEVFEDITLPDELMENRAMEIALTNPGVTSEYNRKKYKYKRGFEDIIKKISDQYFKFETDEMEFFVIFGVNDNLDEQIFTWVNSSLLFDGGICNTQFLNVFYDKTIGHLAKDAKKLKCEVTKNDVRNHLLVIGNLRVSDPQYDAQSKTRLTGPNLRNKIMAMVETQWTGFSRKNKTWLSEVLDRAMVRYHAKANKDAINKHRKNLTKKIPKLMDATSKNRSECQLLITEGDSAASMITDVRDPKIHGSLPLMGKINNVYGTTPAQLLKMGKITDLLTAVGLIPGQRALRSELNYGKLIIATDADVDGGDIFTLLINLLFTYWPELFDKRYEPFIYRLVAPNVCAVKKDKRVHFPTREAYEKTKGKYKSWSIKYFKGLGSMVREDWEMILTGQTNTLIPMVDDGRIKSVLKLLFSNDANARKEWLQANE